MAFCQQENVVVCLNDRHQEYLSTYNNRKAKDLSATEQKQLMWALFKIISYFVPSTKKIIRATDQHVPQQSFRSQYRIHIPFLQYVGDHNLKRASIYVEMPSRKGGFHIYGN